MLLSFLIVGATLLRSRRAPGARVADSLPFRPVLAAILVLTAAAYVPSLRDPLLSDDYILIHASASPADLVRSLTTPAGDRNIRPLGQFVLGTYRLWAGQDPLHWHLLGLLLHLADTLLLLWLTLRLGCARDVALLAAALFALHPAHPEAVAWTASVFDLLATGFVLLTLLAISANARAWFAIPLLTVLAIWSKESAYALPLLAFLLFPHRPKALLLTAATAAALFLHRWHIYAGPGGYLDPTSGQAQILTLTPLFLVKALLYRPWAPLLAGVNWSVFPNFAVVILLTVFFLAGLLLSTRYLASARPARSPFALRLLGATVVSLLPPLHLALIGSDLLGTRVFYLPSVFFCIWLAYCCPSRAAAALLTVVYWSTLHHNLAIRSEVARSARLACQNAAAAVRISREALPVSGLPRSLDGVYFFANGFPECVASATGSPTRF